MMAVLRVILMLLRFAGVLLLALLGILLLILLLGLTAPVRYRGRVLKKEEPDEFLSADGLISWLNPFIRIRVRFVEKRVSYTVRIFGVCVKNSEKPKKEKLRKSRKKRKAKKRKNASEKQIPYVSKEDAPEERTDILPKEDVSDKLSEGKNADGMSGEKTADKLSEKAIETSTEDSGTGFWKKAERLWNTMKDIPGRVSKGVRRIRERVRLLLRKKEAVFSFLQDEIHTAAMGKALTELKGVLFHILPGKIKGYVEFGTGDPESTGKALAVLGILYAAYGKGFTVVPDFYEKRLAGKLTFRGRIRLGTVLVRGIRLMRDKQMKQLYRDWKQVSETLKEKAE